VELGIGVRDALVVAAELLIASDDAVPRGGHLRVTFDRPALERTVSERLRDTLESAPAPRRGRPSGKPGVHSAHPPGS
jgi:hypothetical protein